MHSPPTVPRLACAVAVLWLVSCSSNPAAVDTGPADQELHDLSHDTVPPKVPIVDLRADVNRNGTVDLEDPTEDDNEETWDAQHGAVFLANIDDDEVSCPQTGTDIKLAACNDAADEKVNGAHDLLDLAPLRTVPWPKAPADAVGSLVVSDAARPYVRLFKKQGSGYVALNPETDTLTAAELRAGAELFLEGKDVVRDSDVWDGMVDLTFSVKSPSTAAALPSDKVRLRLAPLVLQHHLMQPDLVMATSFEDDSGSVAMVGDLTKALSASGVSRPLIKLYIDDQWVQDLFEVSTMSMPAAGGAHVIYVYIRSANVENPESTKNPLRSGGKVVFAFRAKDIGAVQQFDATHSMDMDTLDSFGNTETIPPYTQGGQSYPLGRVFRGSIDAYHPDPSMAKLLEAQRVQPPVHVDTSWLLVGHVDETISFVKAPTARGWTIAVNDPTLARTMLQQASAAGHGATKMFVGQKWVDEYGSESSAEVTIDDVLADTDVMSRSATAAVEIDNQLAVLKKETGITDEEILRVPFLHWTAADSALAYQVGTVNGISLGDAHFGAPTPHGPVIDGRDIFEQQLEAELAKVGITVHWIEDWDLYHRLEGEVHCGSNTARQVPTSVRWWESGR